MNPRLPRSDMEARFLAKDVIVCAGLLGNYLGVALHEVEGGHEALIPQLRKVHRELKAAIKAVGEFVNPQKKESAK